MSTPGGEMPPEMGYIALMKRVGVTVTLQDYQEMPALLRADLAIWGAAEINAKAEAYRGSIG